MTDNGTVGRVHTMMCPKPAPEIPPGTPEMKAWDGVHRGSPAEEYLKTARGGLDPVRGDSFHYQQSLNFQDALIGEAIGAGVGYVLKLGGKLAGAAKGVVKAEVKAVPAPPPKPLPVVRGAGVVVAPPPRYGPFHRLVGKEEIELVTKSGEIRGGPARNNMVHSNLKPLPLSLVSALGRCQRHDALAEALVALSPPVLDLRQTRSGKPYNVRVVPHGLDLMLQCMNPDAGEPLRIWGVQSITLHTRLSEPSNFWAFPWPEGVDPTTTKATDISQLFGVVDPESALLTPTMTCFSVPGFEGQVWNMVCVFDSDTDCLETFSLVRANEWLNVPIKEIRA